MDNNEIKNLIVAFKEYRDLLTPIEQNLKEFSLSFDSISSDIKNLNSSFDGNVQQKLDLIVKDLSQLINNNAIESKFQILNNINHKNSQNKNVSFFIRGDYHK